METTVLSLFREKVNQYNDAPALIFRNRKNSCEQYSFRDLFIKISRFGMGLAGIGVKRGDHIGIISNNRKEWMIADLGILGIGALDVPRGSDSSANEIKYILNHAECPICLVEDGEQLEKLLSVKNELPLITSFIVLDDAFDRGKVKTEIAVYTFNEIIEKGKEILDKNPGAFDEEIDKCRSDDLATIIYTSGTTGEPKGVMLTHRNFLHQIQTPLAHVDVCPGDLFISVLPIWHAFERASEYIALFAGSAVLYSKLIGKVILADMEEMKPTIFPSVPRIWETVKTGIYKKISEEGGIKKLMFDLFITVGISYVFFYQLFRGLRPWFKKRIRAVDILVSAIPLLLLLPLKLLGDVLVFSKIRHKLGGRFKFGISGAGALPAHIDKFFAATGILLLEGYGLTEAAPVVSVRKQHAPVSNTIGPPLPEISIKILDPEGKELPPGKKGVLHIKGPNVMKGYYKKPEETNKVLSADGWLNTGDLAMQTWKGELKIMGRQKETIVLMGGENVEPSPIEDTILQSDYIDQVMVVGQDMKYLGALVIPNYESLRKFAGKHNISFTKPDELVDRAEIKNLIKDEINANVNIKKGFKAFEYIVKFTILKKPFEIGDEITQTLKLKRDIIVTKYRKEIDRLFVEDKN